MAAARFWLEKYPSTIIDGLAHFEAVSNAFSTFGREFRVSIDEAIELADFESADLFIEVPRWMDNGLGLSKPAYRRPNSEVLIYDKI